MLGKFGGDFFSVFIFLLIFSIPVIIVFDKQIKRALPTSISNLILADVEEKEEEGEKSKEDLENLNFDEPEEIELPLEEVLEGEVVSIKKPNTIYYEMYKEALKKAKMAKDLALTSYLEAKRIKNQYMLEDLEDSDLEDDTFNSLDD